MSVNYIDIIVKYYPNVSASCNGDKSIYANIIWQGFIITQADLDLKLLDLDKINRIKDIDSKTLELVVSGFTFDSQSFSLSLEAQKDWIGIKAIESLITFPTTITTKDNQAYILTLANLNPFIGTGLATYQAYMDSGRDLKQLINAATTQAELDAVVDNR